MTSPGSLDAAEMQQLVAGISRGLASTVRIRPWKPLPHQVPPPGDWRGWLMLAGRGAGKTDACAHYVAEHVKGPACLPGSTPHWIGFIAPTLGDAATACVNGPSGILAHDPSARMINTIGGTVVRWPNGSEAKLFGVNSPEDVERLRAGGNRCLSWLEELAAWRYLDDGFKQMRFGTRSGPHARWIGSTTPKPRKLIKALHKGDYQRVVVTHATMFDNPHLQEDVRQELLDSYGGQSIGEQELMGRIVEQDENALWKRDLIARYRLDPAEAPREMMSSIAVGVDPSGGAGEQGIVVIGKGPLVLSATASQLIVPTDPDVADKGSFDLAHQVMPPRPGELAGYVLADMTCRLPAEGWGARTVEAAVEWDAGEIVVERNFGGDMARATVVGAAKAMGIPIPVRMETASLGKKVRAQPVSALSARGRYSCVGVHEELEDQLCTWSTDSDYSPDRLDAMVWPAWRLKLVTSIFTGGGSFGGAAAAARRSLTAHRD